VTNTAIISDACTHTLVYFREKKYWVTNRTEFRFPESGSGFSNPDNDPRGAWKADPFQVGGWRPNQQYEILNPITGKIYKPNKGSSWKNEYSKFKELLADNRIVFGKNGRAGPQRKRFLFEAMERGRVATTLWNEVETTTNATQHSKELFGDNAFTNPKPESFIEKILNLSTNPGDYVLDSFLGSGTTAAVAHKMGRRYIGIEMGEQAKTHCAVRLKKVIEGEQGGISKTTGWKGGGGFRFFTLGETVFDREGRIKPDISFEHLAAHIYFTETKTPVNRHISRNRKKKSPFLGIHDGTAYVLLYNGILGDKSVSGGNILTHATLNHIMYDIDMAAEKKGEKFKYKRMVIYGEATRLTHVSLQLNNIVFKQTPYDIKVW
jgi:adenine-specific DNA-methyltransferase